MKLAVEVRERNRSLFLLCKGEVILGDESEYLYNLITKRNSETVVVDLAAVTHVDEHALVMFVLCHTLLSSSHRKIVFRNVSPAVMEAFQRRQLESLFGIDSVAVAEAPLGIHHGDPEPRRKSFGSGF